MLTAAFRHALFVLVYAACELFPLSRGGATWRQRSGNLLGSLKRWVPTALNVLSLAAVVVTVLVLGGIMMGTDAVLRETFTENPRMNCIDVTCVGGAGQMRSVAPGVLAQMRDLRLLNGEVLPGATAGDGERVVEQASGWTDLVLWFLKQGGEADDDMTGGRSVAPDDRLLTLLSFEGGTVPVFGRDEAGVIVSRRLLRDLGYGRERPAHLLVDYCSRPAEVAVLAVAENLWEGEFLMPEGFWEAYRDWTWNPSPEYSSFYLGPLSDADADRLAGALTPLCQESNVKLRKTVRTGSDKWLQFDPPQPWLGKYISASFVPGLRERADLASRGLLSRAELDLGEPERRVSKVEQTGIHYTAATVYVRTIDDVIPTIAALERLGLQCDQRTSQDILWAQQLRTFSSGVAWAVTGIVALMALVNIYLSFAQKAHSTIPQIGILKAFGSGSGTIVLIQVTEAAIIWAMALPIGITLALATGGRVEQFLIATFHLREGLRVFLLPTTLLAGTAAVSLLAVMATSAAATFVAALKRPAEALRYRR